MERGKQVRMRKTLVTVQVALGLVLITAAGLFLRTLSNLRQTETGFRTDRLVQFNLNAGLAGYDRSRAVILFRQILEDLHSLPAVSDATLGVSSILSNDTLGFGLDVEGYRPASGARASANGNAVAAGYFSALGVPIVRGRAFTDSDTEKSARVVIVNESFVKKYFPDRDPLGLKIGIGWGLGTRYDHQIVGVSRDARLANLRDEPLRSFFVPYTQWNVLSSAYFFVRTSVDPSSLYGSIREIVKRHDPDIPVVAYRALVEQIDRLLRTERLAAALSLSFGVLATGLAAIGVYGLTAFSVARRSREIAIRMSLGARRTEVLGMMLSEVAAMGAVGVVLGVVLSLGLSRYVESQLYGVAAYDSLTVATAVAVIAGVALTSAWIPARRATRIDPGLALRQE
jgi:predicted permease